MHVELKRRRRMRAEESRQSRKRPGNIRKWLLNGSMVVALIAAFVVFGVMLQIEKNVLADYEKGVIYTAVKDIPRGQLITSENCRDYFEEQELDKKCIPPTAISDSSRVTGLVAEADIEEGVLLTEGMFEQLNTITAAMEAPVIVGLKAEDLYQIVGGVLRAGDRIHIYSVDKEHGAKVIWKDVFVQQVFDNAGSCIQNGDREAAAQRINVYMESAEVERFYSELALGSLRIVKVCD